jgi:hypothetical protein
MSKPVGYKSPPEHSQFRKGQSGNPSGRPKRPPKLGDDLMAELNEKIPVNIGGRSQRITKQRGLIKALMASALKGDVRAASLLMGWCAKVIEAGPDEKAELAVSAEDRRIIEDYLERQVKLRLAQQGDKA